MGFSLDKPLAAAAKDFIGPNLKKCQRSHTLATSKSRDQANTVTPVSALASAKAPLNASPSKTAVQKADASYERREFKRIIRMYNDTFFTRF